MDSAATQTAIPVRSVVWVTNSDLPADVSLADLGMPQQGLCIPYYVRCSDEQLPAFKELIARHLIRYVANSCDDSTENAPIAGMVRGRLLHRDVVELLGEDFDNDLVYSSEARVDLAYSLGLNPIKVLPGVSDMMLWGKFLMLDGRLVETPNNWMHHPETFVSCRALQVHNITTE